MLSEHFPSYPAGFQQGSLLAGYRLEAQVGAGGMAVVFRARDERLDRLVALKILTPSLASDPEFRRRFIAESRAAAKVDDPHIIPVYEADEANGVLFIAMRFVPGGDLRDVLASEGPLRPERAMEFISPVATALDAAHAAGLVHRDVKPANILVDVRAGRADHVYLSDFGIAKATLSSVNLTAPGFTLGTPDYSAPEHIEGKAVDGRADQYALACVAYQLLTGVVPFQRDQAMQVMFAHMHAPVPSLAERRPDLPAAAGAVLAKGMAKDPGQRFASCGDFAHALRAALGQSPRRPGSPATMAAPARPSGPAPGAWAPRSPVAPPAVAPPAVAPPVAAVTQAYSPDPATTRPVRRTGRRRPVVFSAAAVIAVAAATTAYLTLSGKPATKAMPSAGSVAQAGVLDSPGGYEIFYATFSRDGATVAGFGGLDGTPASTHIYLWDTASKQLTGTLAGSSGWPGGLAFSATGKTLLAGNYDGLFHLWDVASRRASVVSDPDTTNAFTPSILASDYSPEGEFIAEGNSLSNIHLLRLADRQWTKTFTDPAAVNELNHPGTPAGHRYYINQVVVSPSGQALAVSDTKGHVYVWSTSGKSPVITTTGLALASNTASHAMALSPDSATLAIALAGNKGTQLWDLATHQVSATLRGPDKAPEAEAFTADGATLAIGDANGTIYLWDVAARQIAATIRSPISGAGWGGLAFSPDGKTLAAFPGGGTKVYLYKISYTGSALPAVGVTSPSRPRARRDAPPAARVITAAMVNDEMDADIQLTRVKPMPAASLVQALAHQET
jgi:serine/threonine-protein kinase